MGANVFEPEWEGGLEREGWQWQRMDVGKRLGGEKLGASLYELPPGQKSFPYHWHALQEEWLIVLAGTPTLRDPSGERVLAPGDCIAFRCGPDGAHLVANETEEPVRMLMLSSRSDAEIWVYPDSGKVGLSGGGLRTYLDAGAEVDYFHGEE